jgi:hypothetical protein
MSGLHQDILEMLEYGDRPIKIAMLLDIPVSWVYEVLEEENQVDNYSPFETVNS